MTYEQILHKSAVLMNNSAQTIYSNSVLLPYLNMALTELEEIFQLNNIPVTNETSATLTVPANTSSIGFNTVPTLPARLIEIQRLFESVQGQNIWMPITKKNFLTADLLGGVELTSFLIWSWQNQEIRFLPAINPIDIKIDYIQSLFVELTMGNLPEENPILLTDSFLYNRIAGLASFFVGENETRAEQLNGIAAGALDRSLGISVKGAQSIVIRRRPFRAAFKGRRLWI